MTRVTNPKLWVGEHCSLLPEGFTLPKISKPPKVDSAEMTRVTALVADMREKEKAFLAFSKSLPVRLTPNERINILVMKRRELGLI